MLSSVCVSRAGLDGKWPETQFHLTRKRMEPAGMEPLGCERHRWADPSHHDSHYAKLLRLSTESLPYDSAVWCEAKLVTVAIDSPIRQWKPNNVSGVKWIRCFDECDDA